MPRPTCRHVGPCNTACNHGAAPGKYPPRAAQDRDRLIAAAYGLAILAVTAYTVGLLLNLFHQ